MLQVKADARNYRSQDELLDGRSVVVRSITPADKSFLQDEMKHLSPRSRYLRFMTAKKELSDKELVYFSEVDFVRHIALVASIIIDGKEVSVGTGRYIIADEGEILPGAEVAFEVEDEFQGLGVATVLLKHLAIIARNSGLDEFVALVLSENRQMLEVFRHSGLSVETRPTLDGMTEVRLSLR